MIGAIITQLKTGSIKNVVNYGSARPEPPYVVVRRENDAFGRGQIFWIFAHYSPGQQAWLEDYCFDEVITLLDNFATQTRQGNDNQLSIEQDYQDIVVDNDDGTISMGRRFLMPSRTF